MATEAFSEVDPFSVDIYIPSFLFLSTGGGYKAGEQPYTGTRFVCTEIYQNTC